MLLLAVVWLNMPSGKNFVRSKAEAFLRNKLKTEVHIGSLGYGLPKYVVLENVLFKDQLNDTLLSVVKLRVDINMLNLIRKHVDVDEILLEGVHAYIYRNAQDTTFNYDYIISAFAGAKKASPKPKDTSSSGFIFNVNNIILNDIHLLYADNAGGLNFFADLNHLDTRIKDIDLKGMTFHVKKLELDGLLSNLSIDTSLVAKKPDTAKARLNLIADNVVIKHVGFQFDDHTSNMAFALNLENLQLQLNRFDLLNSFVDIKKCSLENTKASLVFNAQRRRPPVIDTIVKIDTTKGWRVLAGDLNLKQIFFKMDNENIPHIASGMDYSHLDIRQLDFKGKGLSYSSDTIQGSIQHVAMQEQCGFELKELRTDFAYYAHGAYLHHLYFQTQGTLLQNFAEIRYASMDILKKHPQFVQLKINLVKSIVDIKDILFFAPQLEQEKIFKENGNKAVKLEADVSGFVNALDIKHFYFSGLNNTELLLNGKLNGLPDANLIAYDLHLAKLSSSSRDVNTFLTDSIIAMLRIPDNFSVSGNIKGTKLSYSPDLSLTSSDGALALKGKLDISKSKGAERYDMKVTSKGLNLGHILRKDSLIGIVTTDIYAKGMGFDIKTMNSVFNGSIREAKFKGYNYNLIKFDGKIAAHIGAIKLESNDTNAHLQLDGNLDFTNKFAAVKADLNIDNMDMQTLKLSKSGLNIKGLIHADIPVLDPDYPNGLIICRHPEIISEGKRYSTDSLYIVSKSEADSGQNIVGELDALHFTISGKTPLSKIGNIIQDHLKRHYQFNKDSTKQAFLADKNKTDTTTIPADYDLTFKAEIDDKPILHTLLPSLVSLKTIKIDGHLSPRLLALHADIPNIQYGSSMLDNGVVQVNGTDSAFTYKISLDRIAESKLQLWQTNISGNLNEKAISVNISIADSVKKEQFALAASLSRDSAEQVLHLFPGLKLNYQVWNVSEQNKIVFTNTGFFAQDFQVSNSTGSIKINSDAPRADAAMNIEISNFSIANITQVISRDTMLAGGILSGNVKIDKWTPALQLNGKISIQDLFVLGDTLGNFNLETSTTDGNAFENKISIEGNGNDLALSGNYYLKEVNGNNFNCDLELKSLNVKSVQGFTMNQVKNCSGKISGKLHVQGTISEPGITGELTTDNVGMTVSALNAHFKMPSDKIVFNNTGLSLSNFEIVDSGGNKAVIDGDIITKNLSAIQMNMQLKANNWKLVHSTFSDNKLFYGDLIISADLHVKGTFAKPGVDGSLQILKGTKLTVVMPEKNSEIESDEGIVQFVNMHDSTKHPIFISGSKPRKDTSMINVVAGSEINVNISIDKNAEFSVIIDEASGDFIRVRGDASLNTSVSSNGDVLLTGNYELHEGSYQLNYNFIKRKFNIQDGSTIIFAGNPLNAEANITAVYEADVPPFDLVQAEVADQSQLNYYKERLPFNVELYLKGKILKPTISFNILLPDNKVYPLSADQIELVQGKLNQVRADTSELNKQVFALLILSHFVAENPFSSGAGQSISTTAIQSVSSFIGQQLNQLTGNLIKGVDVSVDLATTDDYTSGSVRSRTDLNVAASKRLMNDRLKLTIGNDFELDGAQTSTNNSQSNLIPSNLAADYLLSPDGRYTMRAYRKNYNEGVLQGYVTQTGLNFIVSLDYNHFNNLFKKKKTESKETSSIQ